MPTLLRFAGILAVLALVGWGAMWALATFVEPEPREMSGRVAPNRLTGK